MMTLHHVVWALLNSIWQTAVLALAVWGLTKAVSRSTAAQRYATWSAALAAALLLPFANFALAQLGSPTEVHLTLPKATDSTPVFAAKEPGAVTFADAQASDTAAAPLRATRKPLESPQRGIREMLGVWSAGLMSGRFDAALLVLWLIAANLCVARLWFGYIRLSKVKKTLAFRVLSPAERAECETMTRRPVALGYSSDVAEPCVIGFAEPAIALPLDVALRFSKTDTERIIRHECAHIARWDDYANLGKQIALAVLCFNPIVYAIAKVLDLEREIACDDAAASLQADRADFARCLCDIALLKADRRWLPTAGLAKNRSQLLVRVRRLLDGRHLRSTRVGAFTRLAIAVIVFGAVPFALVQIVSPYVAPASASALPPPIPSARIAPRLHLVVAKVEQKMPGVHARVMLEQATRIETSAVHVPIVVNAQTRWLVTPHVYLSSAPISAVSLRSRLPMTVAVVREMRNPAAERDAFLDALHDAGFHDLSVEDVIAIHNAGVSPQFLAELHARGLTPMPARDLVALANAGVDAAYLAGLKANGYASASVNDVVALRNAGVQVSYIAALAQSGYRDISVRDLIRLTECGITTSFLVKVQTSHVTGNRRLSVDELIRLAEAGV